MVGRHNLHQELSNVPTTSQLQTPVEKISRTAGSGSLKDLGISQTGNRRILCRKLHHFPGDTEGESKWRGMLCSQMGRISRTNMTIFSNKTLIKL